MKKLVFEGGGIKGIAYAGALQVLEEEGILKGVTHVAGTSAGAITAALLAVAYSAKEITDIILDTGFEAFEDDDLGIMRDTIRLFNGYGWYKGDKLQNWMKKLIDKATGEPELTFAGLKRKVDGVRPKGNSRFRDLRIVGTNLSKQRAEVFSFENTPDMPIALAVRISMSIPLFFKPVEYEGDLYVDGGISKNYPIDIYDSVVRGRRVPDSEVLGFRVDSKNEIISDKNNWDVSEALITNLFGYIKAVGSFVWESANRAYLAGCDSERTVFIDSLGIKAVDFDIERDKQLELVASGRSSTEKCFSS